MTIDNTLGSVVAVMVMRCSVKAVNVVVVVGREREMCWTMGLLSRGLLNLNLNEEGIAERQQGREHEHEQHKETATNHDHRVVLNVFLWWSLRIC